MTSCIHRLPNHLINLIAAGEVVERPASIVKELIENGLDAGARRIDVRLSEGGIAGIEIQDDGRGMSPIDLALCFERHATSKIIDETSLEAISTFGFRGEAVSSIAAVARLTIKTRLHTNDGGHSRSCDFGQLGEPAIVGMPPGTIVMVTELFERLPARLKFLKSPSTELGHVMKVVKEIALGNPGIQFFVSHGGHGIKSFLAGDRSGRIEECLRPNFEPMHIQESQEGISLEAYLSPAYMTSDRAELCILVNRRSVRNRNLISAVRHAYRETLGPHHEPSGVVYLDIRFDYVDVNVHPQKTEVRLRSENLFSWIGASIRKKISTSPQTVTQWVKPSQQSFEPPVFTARGIPVDVAANLEFQESELLRVSEPSMGYEVEPLVKECRIRYLGQIRASYLVCEDMEGLLLIDQHALHEKFKFEELVTAHQTHGISSQRLLVPQVVRLAPELAAIIDDILPILSRLGLEVETLEGTDAVIRSIPTCLQECEAEHLLMNILTTVLSDGKSPTLETLVRPFLATVACHSVVRAGQKLSDVEAESLIDFLSEIQMGWTCPHGRPVLFRMGYGEMERYFKRA